MCGRFSLSTPLTDIAAMVESEPLSDVTPFEPSWNIGPRRWVPVISQTGPDSEPNVPRHLRLMQWGFRPSWAKPSNREPINARVETVQEKPMFRASFERRRCVVPANGWYEWMTTPNGKVPFFHQQRNGDVSYMAAVWDGSYAEEGNVETFALLTTEANEDCRDVHHRMPVLMTLSELEPWLANGALPQPLHPGTIDRYPVSREVNRTETDHAGLVLPLKTLFNHEYGA